MKRNRNVWRPKQQKLSRFLESVITSGGADCFFRYEAHIIETGWKAPAADGVNLSLGSSSARRLGKLLIHCMLEVR